MEFVFRREWIIFGVIGLISIALIGMTMRSKSKPKQDSNDSNCKSKNPDRQSYQQLSRNKEISEEKLLYQSMKKHNDKKTLEAVAFVEQAIQQFTYVVSLPKYLEISHWDQSRVFPFFF